MHRSVCKYILAAYLLSFLLAVVLQTNKTLRLKQNSYFCYLARLCVLSERNMEKECSAKLNMLIVTQLMPFLIAVNRIGYISISISINIIFIRINRNFKYGNRKCNRIDVDLICMLYDSLVCLMWVNDRILVKNSVIKLYMYYIKLHTHIRKIYNAEEYNENTTRGSGAEKMWWKTRKKNKSKQNKKVWKSDKNKRHTHVHINIY